MEDKKIVVLLFARAENAISELSKRFGKQLHRIAYNILGNRLDAEECTNDTYFALWNAIPPVSPDPLAPYVYRTGRNTALKRLHRDTAKKRDSRYDVSLEEFVLLCKKKYTRLLSGYNAILDFFDKPINLDKFIKCFDVNKLYLLTAYSLLKNSEKHLIVMVN